MCTHLDAFRFAYTFNWTGEQLTTGTKLGKGMCRLINAIKIAEWFPSIGQIVAIGALIWLFKKTLNNEPIGRPIALYSRNLIALTGVLNPALFFVDTVGTVVKICADKLNKK